MIVADLGDCDAWTRNGKFPVDGSLNSWSERLKDAGFVRVHRNALVNIEHVQAITEKDELVLPSTQIAVSRRRVEEVRKRLGL